jgi:hypothetical protein
MSPTPQQEDFLGNGLDPLPAQAEPQDAGDDPVFDAAAVDDPTFDEPVAVAVVETAALVHVLPADFPLPKLIKFVPDERLRVAIEQATTYALSIEVTGQEGIQRADLALGALRDALKNAAENFAEPKKLAHQLHKHITSKESEWCGPGEQAAKTVGHRVWQETRRLEQIEADKRRKEQEEANRKAREDARKEAEAAAAAQAPEPVVEELKRQAEVATAPPVTRPAPVAPMRSSTTVTKWKCRIAGTPADAEPNPEMAELTAAQKAAVLEAMAEVVASGGRDLTIFDLNWKVLNQRASADKGTFSIKGFESYEDGGVRGKGGRRS